MPILDELRPIRRQRVYDLVHQAGVDVSDWERTKGNSKSAAVNPNYCFHYSFMGDDAFVVNLWHDKMEETDGRVRYTFHPRRSIEMTTGNKHKRAKHLEMTLRRAAASPKPIRAIVVAGSRKGAGATKTSVTRRLLDPVAWRVETYDVANDRCILVRQHPHPTFIDQFTEEEDAIAPPKTKTVISNVAERCPTVRRNALIRANGVCQYGGCAGFTTPSGAIFLETHHVIPLSEGGPDTLDNVVALCPNHHREAHHGIARDTIRERLLDYLASA